MSTDFIDELPPLFSNHWYRVKDLHPCLKAHTEVHRHDYRDEVWYVLQDHASARHHRFSQDAWQLIGLLDGKRDVDTLWQQLNTKLGDDAPTQDDVIAVLGQLHSADVLQCEITPSLSELFERGQRRDKSLKASRFKNPIAIRFPLVDPNRFLDKTYKYIKPLMSRWALILCLFSIFLATLLAARHWQALSLEVSVQALQMHNLVLMFFIYPVMKIFHELGHAYAVKKEGGEVHDMGVMLLALMPIPYVDASASSAFRHKRHRILVSMMGMLVELQISALALFLWLNIEPGLVRDIALNVMLIGGVSTLLFNGNPLLRYDAYYALSDMLALPNLAQRSNRYIGYLFQHHLFGIKQAVNPANNRSETIYFFSYSVLSFLYRTALMLTIAIYLAGQLFFIGVLLALWVLISQLLMPLVKLIRFVSSSTLGPQRLRAVTCSIALTLFIVAGLTLMPVPSNTQFQGVVWLPGDTRINTKVDAFVKEILVSPGQQVSAGQALLQLGDPELQNQLEKQIAVVAQLEAEYIAERQQNKVKASAIKAQLRSANAALNHAREKVDALLITSPRDGEFVLAKHDDLKGAYVRQGELLAYVLSNANATAQVPVTQRDLDRIESDVNNVQVRLASAVDTILTANIIRSTPQASQILPSKVLSTAGGGLIATDPTDKSGLKSLEPFFHFEVELPLTIRDVHLGTRVYVRFEHQAIPIAQQMYRRLRQLFLSQFHV